ncbi:peptidoglycan bridge formation glycyltransferase FemA/FemB family protein [Candidatus Pacearchaeota archaeon]|nr:peptidoglycan bridge formation glycyltransferase FemA/FemB family protein [Candidatus Pacearchaeota archaeon]
MFRVYFSLPEYWNNKILEASETAEFANASKYEGEVLFFEDEENTAVVIVKKKFSNVFSRAQIFSNSTNENFLIGIFENLRKKGVAYARVGNTMFGLEKEVKIDGADLIERHTFTLDLNQNLEDIWAKFDKKLRNSIRKAEKEKVIIQEISDEKEIREYYKIALETEENIKNKKGRKTFSLQRYDFFRELFANKLGRFFIAKSGDKIIAGALFLVLGEKSVYFHSCLSRKHVEKQAPSLIHWEAIKKFKKESIKKYDLGGVTIGLDKNDSRFFVYEFKRKFNGELVKFYNVEIALSKFKKKIQDLAMKIIYGEGL